MALVFGLLTASAKSESCNATFTYNGPTDDSYQYTVKNPDDDINFKTVELSKWTGEKWQVEWAVIGVNTKTYTFEIPKNHFSQDGHYHRFRVTETDDTVEGAWYINKDSDKAGDFYKNENPWGLPLAYRDGGITIPVNKIALLAPYIALVAVVVSITIGAVYPRKRWFGRAIVQRR